MIASNGMVELTHAQFNEISQDAERLRAENEQLREQVRARPDQEAIDMAVSRAVLAERELTALRRPVEQSETLDSRPIVRAACDTLAMYGAAEGMAADILADALIVRAYAFDLLSMLDTTARQLRERVEMLEAARLENNRLVVQDARSTGERIAMQQEIARLSSPPPERADIVERHKARIPLKERYKRLYFFRNLADEAHDDVDTLLGDRAAWRNAHALVTAERDEARGKAKQLEIELGHYHENTGLVPVHQRDTALSRIERLEGALRWYANPGHWCALDDGSDQEQENCLTEGLDHGWLRAHNALAASQQHTPTPSRVALRDLVDRVWNEATESEQVPHTEWADRIIDKWMVESASPQHTAGSGDGVAGD